MGSTRRGRFSEKPAYWIAELLKKQPEVAVETLDLRDYPMPFFEEEMTPSMVKKPYAHEAVERWWKKISEADGFIFVTPEYNHGYPAVLKNALDYVYYPWNKKAVGFVGYGSVMGARSIEQLRQVVAELQMVSIRAAVHIPREVYMAASETEGEKALEAFTSLDEQASIMISQLLWWAKALQVARENDTT